MIRAILACDDAWGIGKHGTLPWAHNPEDQKWFKDCTTGGVVVMGKKTWLDPDMPKPLPNRVNVVVSTSLEEANGATVKGGDIGVILTELEQAYPDKDIWVIGGAELVEHAMHSGKLQQIWLSRIAGVFDCDTFLYGERINELYEIYSQGSKGNLWIEQYTRKEV